MLEYKLAFRNLFGAGLRTWLNVTVLSIAFVIIIFYNGMLDGWNRQARNDTKAWECGSGQIWHHLYDPYDQFSIIDAHAKVPSEYKPDIDRDLITPVLIVQATAYPGGRLVNVLLKGITPSQAILELPTAILGPRSDSSYADGYIPAIIGTRMAQSARLKKGDNILVRWRDVNGTFDAREVTIAAIYKTTVPTIDNGQIWIPLEKLREMTSMPEEATYMVMGSAYKEILNAQGDDKHLQGWIYKDEKALLKELDDVIAAKKGGSKMIYSLLLAIALLAIFDTQVLSIFRRQKEIGTYIALGMTRLRVVWIFTIEGSTHSILAILLGSIWGIPLLMLIQKTGIPMPSSADQAGLAIGDSISPFYSAGMILSTILLVVISSTIVSYLPTRRISKMKPTDALRGKII